jgi:endoglucanase
MKKTILLFAGILILQFSQANTVAQTRAAKLKKAMNLAVWLESGYWFFNTTTFPDATRYTENDIKNLHDLCFETVRLPVFFEPFAGYTAPYNFDMANQNVVRGLSYVDSVIAWTGKYNMNLVIDNHLADDDNSNSLQTHYQITDANYTAQAELMSKVWRQVIARYSYADPERVFFELRNEPNTVSDANLRIVYQTMIDTIRRYDHTHTLIVGNTGYYDAVLLAGSTPYTDTNLIYTFHIYDGNSYPGFCFQGQDGVPATDSLAGVHNSFARHGAQAADITTEVQNVHTWSVTNGVPVWLGEFGCTTLPKVYGDDTSRCNYIQNFGAVLDATHIPWAYWDGYGPDEYVTSYDGGTTLTYLFSMFDRSNVLDASHLNPCFAAALHIGNNCVVTPGVHDVRDMAAIAVYPNPANSTIYLTAPANTRAEISDMSGRLWRSADNEKEIDISNLPAGMYFVSFYTSDGGAAIRKFVKQ